MSNPLISVLVTSCLIASVAVVQADEVDRAKALQVAKELLESSEQERGALLRRAKGLSPREQAVLLGYAREQAGSPGVANFIPLLEGQLLGASRVREPALRVAAFGSRRE